uniref:FA core complex associated protein 24 n=1 Tax=Eptatretus burgeri TaxID=7764 RepID=A0A8C4Q3I4_EPTBU
MQQKSVTAQLGSAVPPGHVRTNEKWRGSMVVQSLQGKLRLLFEEQLGLVDFQLSNRSCILYISETDLVAGSAYKRKLVQFRKVRGLHLYWTFLVVYCVWIFFYTMSRLLFLFMLLFLLCSWKSTNTEWIRTKQWKAVGGWGRGGVTSRADPPPPPPPPPPPTGVGWGDRGTLCSHSLIFPPKPGTQCEVSCCHV